MSYLADALKACGGMVDLKLTNAVSPMLFTTNGYQLVVMPMLTDKAKEQAKPTETVAEQTEPTKPKKARRNRQKEPVAV